MKFYFSLQKVKLQMYKDHFAEKVGNCQNIVIFSMYVASYVLYFLIQ